MAQTTIQGSFLGDGTVTGVKIGADFISAQTALGSGLATTDEIIVSDAGVIKRMDISVLEIAATQITASGTLPALNGAALTALTAANITASGTLPALNGAALTALTAANITASGTLPALNGAALTALSAANITASGTLPALVGTALTALDASNLSTGTLPAARIAADSIVEEKLDISNGPQNGYYLQTNGSGVLTWATVAAGGDFSNGGDNGALVLGTNDSNSLTFETNNTARMAILSGGNIGIGASNPLQLLHIEAAGDAGIAFSRTSGFHYAMGVDDSDSDRLKIGHSTTIGSSVALTINGDPSRGLAGINMPTGDNVWTVGYGTFYIKNKDNFDNLLLLAEGSDTDAGEKLTTYERGSGGGSGAHSYVGSTAVNIMKAGGAGSRGALLLVHGEADGDTQAFTDMVICPVTGGFSNDNYSASGTSNGSGNVIFRLNMRGSPANRTYSLGATNTIYLAMSSGNYNIVTFMMGASGIST